MHVVWTSADDGDHGIGVDPDTLAARRRAVIEGRSLTWLRQVHGTAVCAVDASVPAGALAGVEADGAVTSTDDSVLSVVTADCAPIALWSDDGVVAAVHAGWRGLADGVVTEAVRAVRARASDDASVHAALGPCIGPECYEFGGDELAILERRLGPSVRSTTASGSLALDLPLAVGCELAALGVGLDTSAWCCTACTDRWFSWRARKDRGRQAMYVWKGSR